MKHTIYNSIKRGVLALVVLFSTTLAFAQDGPLFSQQWLSRLNRNPAAAGASGNLFDATMFYRNQWDNTLGTTLVNAEGYIDGIKSNLGFTFSYDKMSKANQNVNALASYAYRFSISERLKLSFGLAAGIMNRNFNPGKLELESGMDPGMVYEKSNSLKADFSAGAELTSQRLTVGLGITHLGNSSSGVADDAYMQQQIYTYGRYLIGAADKLDIAPAISWLHYGNDDLFEAGVSGIYDSKYWAGVAWRPNTSMVFSAGLELFMFRLGYAYDLSIGDGKTIGGGTHEILLQVRLAR